MKRENQLRTLYNLHWVALIVLMFMIAGCATVPVTGRRSLNLIPESQELALGLESYQQVLSESEIVKSGAEFEMVRRVGRKIAAASDRPGYEWEFSLIRDEATVNAFCLPGGKVAIYTGILPVAENEAGLATVMAHEIAHAIARHGGERMTDDLAFQIGGMGLEALLNEKSETTRSVVLAAYGIGGQVGILLPFSRAQESEADHIGLVYMAKAGYDPRESIRFWERMGKSAGGSAPPEWLSTHPSHGTRVEQLQKWMPEALTYYKPAP
ncbi:MAG: M48 family metallopeptidase [Candidatus Eisenbacteria bacterium]|uniref:M48 family metallopeptidase n=1 Tax=Eiseniibacteriota bacterium TaxID=2212470 RepID=A0A948RXE0_UNCEI|nr:M48 family metallopeptidase [Candidatus Eisenbacteria bacterium]MBU1950583.1 M48 family metallopeptidase [Candidatus Eisenbacteria bacterium]MBU2692610.1 M48 family metallopeptidase [Candidatus Eisenbacteria bacterium]